MMPMTLFDYNGEGNWTREAVQQRYSDYTREFKVRSPANLTPMEHIKGERRWVYPIMERVIEAMEKDDPAAIQIGVEFIEQDQHFPFGKILKSNTARALRRAGKRASLSSYQEERIRSRIVTMLLNRRVPHEYKEYAKLLRQVGLGEWWPVIEENIARGNHYVMRYYHYLQHHVLTSDAP